MELMHVTRNVSHDAALKEVEDCRGEIAALNNEKRKLEQSYEAVLVEKNKVTAELSAKMEMINVYEQRFRSLNDRVLQLEAKQALNASKHYVFVGTACRPLLHVTNFLNALFPDKALFDLVQ